MVPPPRVLSSVSRPFCVNNLCKFLRPFVLNNGKSAVLFSLRRYFGYTQYIDMVVSIFAIYCIFTKYRELLDSGANVC